MVKKQNNINWLMWIIMVVAVVALVLAIVAFSKASITGQGIFGFRNNQLPGGVNSNACNADSICETKSIQVGEEGYVNSEWKIEGLASLSTNTLNFYDMVHNWTLPTLSLMSESDNSKILILHGGFDVNKIVVNEQLKLISETGNNNAYACFTSQGVLYRSESPCV